MEEHNLSAIKLPKVPNKFKSGVTKLVSTLRNKPVYLFVTIFALIGLATLAFTFAATDNFSGSLNQRNPTREHTIIVESQGELNATIRDIGGRRSDSVRYVLSLKDMSNNNTLASFEATRAGEPVTLSTSVEAGTYTLTVASKDSLSKRGSRYSLDVQYPDPAPPANPADTQPPILTVSQPTAGSTVSGAFTIAGSASDDTGVAQVKYRFAGGSWQIATGTVSWSGLLDATTQANGTLNIELEATDSAGNIGSKSVSVNNLIGAPPPSTSEALPFGVFFPPDNTWGSEFSGGFLNFTPSTIIRDLNMVRAAGGSMVANFVGKKETHQNTDGTINVDMWKAVIAQYAGIDLSSYVADGTLLAHYMTDEPKSRGSWGEQIVHNSDIDEMARYSKTLWPTLPTTVRVSPSKLTEHAGGYDVLLPDWKWQYLDIGWAQYSARFGPVTDYLNLEIAEAKRQGLGLIFGLNVIDGGDGSSQVPGVRTDVVKWSMSADELRNYAGALIRSDAACTFLMWRYDWNDYVYFERSDIRDAVSELARLAASRSVPRCSLR